MTARSKDFVRRKYEWIGNEKDNPGFALLRNEDGTTERWRRYDNEPEVEDPDMMMKGKSYWYVYCEEAPTAIAGTGRGGVRAGDISRGTPSQEYNDVMIAVLDSFQTYLALNVVADAASGEAWAMIAQARRYTLLRSERLKIEK